ncbi:hypothetical protein FNV43_RR18063 [Rhamnella rubrinervis]|uniref:RRM domain-containing protein n=1 Tax=Rhamnella rubrinervis TaxID=2594499 RepID=A0A8K0E5I3_9ROSA|nr:hypothetical protein FNV43_RR18063 [Rhamnella rubrinervis]
MAATCLSLRPLSSSSFIATHNTRASPSMSKPHVHVSLYSPLLRRSIQLRYSPNRTARISTAMAVVDGEAVVADKERMDDYHYDHDYLSRHDDNRPAQWKNQSTPCELYVCNLPRSCDIPDLMDMFKPFGTVISVEICRNPETGVSRGCGYVTVGSMAVAKAAIVGLDASDVGGREMRVRFSVHMNTKRRNSNATSSTPVKSLIYESPHKLYVGNLAWAVEPEELRNRFSQFGTVTSTRVLHDRKAGISRAYGFLSFSSAAERDSAMCLDGTELNRLSIVLGGVTWAERVQSIAIPAAIGNFVMCLGPYGGNHNVP